MSVENFFLVKEERLYGVLPIWLFFKMPNSLIMQLMQWTLYSNTIFLDLLSAKTIFTHILILIHKVYIYHLFLYFFLYFGKILTKIKCIRTSIYSHCCIPNNYLTKQIGISIAYQIKKWLIEPKASNYNLKNYSQTFKTRQIHLTENSNRSRKLSYSKTQTVVLYTSKILQQDTKLTSVSQF